jgi:hypothetical protein
MRLQKKKNKIVPSVVPINKYIANKIGTLSEKMMKAKVSKKTEVEEDRCFLIK